MSCASVRSRPVRTVRDRPDLTRHRLRRTAAETRLVRHRRVMSAEPHDELRALALWHTSRRAVDELLEPLLEYGPVAVDRVADRLSQVRALVAEEQRAFDAFVDLVLLDRGEPGVVLEMFGRRADDVDVLDR